MCGLFGFLSRRRSAHDLLGDPQPILRSLAARGPDGSGTFVDDAVALLHTRLALVDVDPRSDQPMWDSSGRYCLVYNGEIYGYQGLRDELQGQGARLRTTSDTEVLLESLCRFGVDSTLRRVDGMFAFALYDRIAGQVTLARDRGGMKPLFVWETPEFFAFASSVQALHAWSPLKPDLLTVQTFLQGYALPTTGRTFFAEVQSVVPGTITWSKRNGPPRMRTFAGWSDLDDPALAEELARETSEQWVDRLDEQLTASVQSQLAADAPVGALCSGGVDSALVAAIARRIDPALQLFHANVLGPQSEYAAAQRVASHLNLPLHRVDVDQAAFIEHFAEVTYHFGAPFLCQLNSVPFLLLSQLVHRHGVKAVVCGEAADESFLGYEWLMPNIRKTLRQLPVQAHQRIKAFVNACEQKLRGQTKLPPLTDRDAELVRSLPHGFERELNAVDSEESLVASMFKKSTIASLRSFTDSGHLAYILRTLLHRNDSLGMAASIETRYPFLDRNLLRLSHNLPLSAKLRIEPRLVDWRHPFVRDKWVLRRLASRYLPPSIGQRAKYAFTLPSHTQHRVATPYFDDSPLLDWYRLSRPKLRYFLDNSTPRLRLRLTAIDVWSRLFFAHETIWQVRDRLSAASFVSASPTTALTTTPSHRTRAA